MADENNDESKRRTRNPLKKLVRGGISGLKIGGRILLLGFGACIALFFSAIAFAVYGLLTLLLEKGLEVGNPYMIVFAPMILVGWIACGLAWIGVEMGVEILLGGDGGRMSFPSDGIGKFLRRPTWIIGLIWATSVLFLAVRTQDKWDYLTGLDYFLPISWTVAWIYTFLALLVSSSLALIIAVGGPKLMKWADDSD
ncbi:MAG: hypothetical protein ACI9R3_006578 [Verrucomicrobiales bacterium]|jgi:hypothetical protein